MDKAAKQIVRQVEKVSRAEKTAYNALFLSVFGSGHLRKTGRRIQAKVDPATFQRTFLRYLKARSNHYRVYSESTQTMLKRFSKMKKNELKKSFGSLEFFKTTQLASTAYAEILDDMAKDTLTTFLLAKVVFALIADKSTGSMKKAILTHGSITDREHALLSKHDLVSSAALNLFLRKQSEESGKVLPYVA